MPRCWEVRTNYQLILANVRLFWIIRLFRINRLLWMEQLPNSHPSSIPEWAPISDQPSVAISILGRTSIRNTSSILDQLSILDKPPSIAQIRQASRVVVRLSGSLGTLGY